jgi:hypothetical protein
MRIASGLAIAFSAGLLKPSEVFAEVTEAAEVAWGSDWNGAVYSAKSLEAFVIAMNGDTTTPNTPRTVTERGRAPGLSEAPKNQLIIDARARRKWHECPCHCYQQNSQNRFYCPASGFKSQSGMRWLSCFAR